MHHFWAKCNETLVPREGWLCSLQVHFCEDLASLQLLVEVLAKQIPSLVVMMTSWNRDDANKVMEKHRIPKDLRQKLAALNEKILHSPKSKPIELRLLTPEESHFVLVHQLEPFGVTSIGDQLLKYIHEQSQGKFALLLLVKQLVVKECISTSTGEPSKVLQPHSPLSYHALVHCIQTPKSSHTSIPSATIGRCSMCAPTERGKVNFATREHHCHTLSRIQHRGL